MNATAARIAAALHRVDVYEGFPYQDYPEDLDGWNSRSPVFVELIEELRPELVIELGTFKGASAAYMCEVMERAGIPGAILCIDTWLGSELLWHHADDPAFGRLRRYMRFGRPVELYHQFVANMMHRGLCDRVVPFPNTTANAARWLRDEGVRPGLVYIDASHAERDVYHDLVDYWELVKNGGAVVGDDWSPIFPGVERAVTRFAREAGCEIELREDTKWFLRKPS